MGFFKFGKGSSKKVFKEAENTCAFTTVFVSDQGKDITYVSHDLDEGSWQFHSNDKFENFAEVAKVVSLGWIVASDPSVNEIADLPMGYHAWRDQKGSKWNIAKQD